MFSCSMFSLCLKLLWPLTLPIHLIRLARCGSATTVDSERHSEWFCWPHKYVAATTTSVLDAFSGICHGSSTGKFLSLELRLPTILMSCVGICFGVSFLLSGSHVVSISICRGSAIVDCNITAFCVYPCQAYMCLLVMVCGPHQEWTEWLLLHCHELGRVSCCSSHCSLSHSNNMVRHTALGAWQSHLIPPPFLHGGEGSFPGCTPPSGTFESRSCVVIRYLGLWINSLLVSRVFHCVIIPSS